MFVIADKANQTMIIGSDFMTSKDLKFELSLNDFTSFNGQNVKLLHTIIVTGTGAIKSELSVYLTSDSL